MLASSKSRLVLIAAVAAVSSAALIFYPTEEKRVRAAAEAIVAAANESDVALARALDTHATPNVRLNVSELPEPLVGRDALLAAAEQARRLEQKLHFQLDTVEVTVEGGRARVSADVITTLRPELPELRRPRRSVALFEKQSDAFRLVNAEIGPEQLDQPEARP
jgi:ketosteroid isomerase-like protein